jgi:hypothetical protein
MNSIKSVLNNLVVSLLLAMTLVSTLSLVTQAQSTPNKPVLPVLEKIIPLSNGKFEALFGYQNQNSSPISIPVGGNNYFNIDPKDRGQTTEFKVGRQYGQFSITMDCSQTLVWTLAGPDNQRRTSTASTSKCSSTPPAPDFSSDVTAPQVSLSYTTNLTIPTPNQIRILTYQTRTCQNHINFQA